MATLKNTTIAGTEYLQIPKGNYIQRPQLIPRADVFTSVGTTTWTCPAGVTTVEALVIAGGGAGGGHGSGGYYNDPGGGGGAGGVVYRRDYPVTPGQSYTVTVGDGGAAVSGADGENGDNSVFATLTAIGGGGGGVGTLFGTTQGNANNGGSGGGGAHGYTANSGFGGDGTAGQGNPGGNTFGGANGAHYGQNVTTQTGAGGGGAGEPGHHPVYKGGTWNSGAGGAGLYFPQFEKYGGSPAGWFAGGGGSGGSNRSGDSPTAALGGLGGGGRGGNNNGSSGMSTGTANTGGGGGGAGGQTSAGNNVGAAGGSGIVILKYDEPTETSSDPRRYIRYNTDVDNIEIYSGEKGWQAQDISVNFAGHNYTKTSETFTDWNNYQASLSSGVTAPDGIGTSIKLASSTSSTTYSFLNYNTTQNGLLNSTLSCFSIYAKQADYSRLGFSNRSSFSMAAIVDLTNGAVIDTQNSSGTILSVNTQELEDGWYRCWIVMPVTNQFNIHPVPASVSSASTLLNSTISYSSGSGIYVWGSQWEINTHNPGPYTKTVTAHATAPKELAGYRTHVYKETGESSFTPAFTGPVEVMVVAGGGAGGGGDVGGGGGAGGLLYENSFYVESDENYKVIVGAGGTGVASSSSRGNRGNDSRFGPLVAIGGGGGSGWGGGDGSQGGSGGGSTANGRAGPGVVGQGRYGSDRGLASPNYPQGGGGGAGGEGMDPPDHFTCGNGGVGLYFPQFEPFGGSPPGWFAGGGGGAAESNQNPDGTAVGIGGLGGGGNGGRQTNNVTVENGVANTGGGGGGDDPGAGGTGGSGIVIVRYKFRE